MILVFGRGQVGQELVAAAGREKAALSALAHDQADITDPQAVSAAIEKARPSIVVNAAAYTRVDLAEREPAEAERVNVRGPEIIADACARASIPVIHISTDYVFDGQKPGAYRESDATGPLQTYGRTKLAGEIAVRARNADHIILRTSWVYSVYGRNFLKTIIERARTGQPLRVVADQTGCPTSAADLAEAILRLAALVAGGNASRGTYHFAGRGATTWHGFASRIVAAQAAFTGLTPPVERIATRDYPTAAERPANSTLDCSLFAATFGLVIPAWEESTDRTVAAHFAREGVA